MMHHDTSSGDLNADRRLSYAEAMLAGGDPVAAAEIMADAMLLAPDWVAGWVRYGEMAEAAGLHEAARAAYEAALGRDPADRFGASLHLMYLTDCPVTDTAPAAHMQALFDQYAPRFEASLVDALGYCAPSLLAAYLEGHLGRVLDLGCGTGLMGGAIKGRFDHLTGYDISTGMLEQARRKGIYNVLEQHDLNALPPVAPQYDLVVTADVLIYFGALEQIIEWSASALVSGGRLALTVEKTTGRDFRLQKSRRFAHSEDYIRRLLSVAGLNVLRLEHTSYRKEQGADVPTMLVIAQKP